MTVAAEKSEIQRNYEAFLKQLPELLASHRGKFALMREGAIVEFFDTAADAYRAGQQLFPEQKFSLQEVTDSPVDLGSFSYAVPHGQV